MNYGYIDKKHILEKVEKICDCIGHGLYGTAVVLSKARGERWNATSAFIYGYLALLDIRTGVV